ncbi:hypothetical protein K492DRAFT_177545 [Lichtheimia hyalospora FSU 10163]|nr:hypothetical protein K492DRAFT_177545 [Lichtheimia hyalospora FSU 10163]
MAVIVKQHFIALGSSYQQLVSCIATRWIIGALAFFFLVDINLQEPVLVPLDAFSTSQYVHVYYLVKIWIICAYAICDA